MGFIWDSLQQSQISDNYKDLKTTQAKVKRLEKEVKYLRQDFFTLVSYLEEKLNVDIDGDGKIG